MTRFRIDTESNKFGNLEISHVLNFIFIYAKNRSSPMFNGSEWLLSIEENKSDEKLLFWIHLCFHQSEEMRIK